MYRSAWRESTSAEPDLIPIGPVRCGFVLFFAIRRGSIVAPWRLPRRNADRRMVRPLVVLLWPRFLLTSGRRRGFCDGKAPPRLALRVLSSCSNGGGPVSLGAVVRCERCGHTHGRADRAARYRHQRTGRANARVDTGDPPQLGNDLPALPLHRARAAALDDLLRRETSLALAAEENLLFTGARAVHAELEDGDGDCRATSTVDRPLVLPLQPQHALRPGLDVRKRWPVQADHRQARTRPDVVSRRGNPRKCSTPSGLRLVHVGCAGLLRCSDRKNPAAPTFVAIDDRFLLTTV